MQGSLASYLAQITAAGQRPHLADAAATRGRAPAVPTGAPGCRAADLRGIGRVAELPRPGALGLHRRGRAG